MMRSEGFIVALLIVDIDLSMVAIWSTWVKH